MKILLLKSVPKLGLPGDTKQVADGYARNYLLPRGLAVLTIDPRATQLAAELARAREQAQAAQVDATDRAKDWAGKSVTITAPATADGTLYAAVNARDVAKELGLDPKQISFTSVKTAGSSEARINLGAGVDTPVMVEVKAKTK